MRSIVPTPLERSIPKLPADYSSNTVNKTELYLFSFLSPQGVYHQVPKPTSLF